MRFATTLVALGCLLPLCPLSAEAQASQPRPKLVSVEGIVIDDGHSPIESAEVGLKLGVHQPVFVRTGTDGRFIFTDIALEPGSISVRRLGYHALTMSLDMVKVGGGKSLEL